LAEVSLSVFPEAVLAEATGTSLTRADRTAGRASTADQVPAFADALAGGRVSGEHVDAVTAGLRSLEPAERRLFAGEGERLAKLAEVLDPDAFKREVSKTARTIRADGGMARLERQRRDVRFTTWVEPSSGMVCVSGRFDPVTGGVLISRLDQHLDRLHHQPAPALCPSDPLERQRFLRGRALLDLLHIPHPDSSVDDGTEHGRCSCAGRVDLSLVVDATTWLFGEHPGSRVDCGIAGLDLPLDTIRRMACFADISLAFVDEDGVLLKLGRSRRLANDDQRRALRIMYRHCAMPACTVPVSRCEPHHTLEWDADHGPTDIEFLVPSASTTTTTSTTTTGDCRCPPTGDSPSPTPTAPP
jgi:hypothetical protein